MRGAAPGRVVVLGGAGAFGRRLVDGLLATAGFEVVVAGRSGVRAEALAAEMARLHPGARLTTALLDRARPDPDALGALAPAILVDAAGPFQGGDLGLARAALRAGLHYVDLADARDFVAGFPALDAEARGAGLVALTGASSTPALSHAALDRITSGWRRVEAVEVAISPGNRAPRGLSVIEAIFSYAGRPVRVFEGGAWRTRPGWGGLVRRHLPGLGPRWLSVCETPDLDLVPARFHTSERALFRAGLEVSALHLGLWLASLPVRAGLVGSLRPLARPARAMAELFAPFGTDRGGMLVEAWGLDAEGRRVRARWWLVAAAGDGPFVPTLPALAALRAIAAGQVEPGARACVGVLPLDAIEAEMRRHRLRTRLHLERPDDPLFARALGESFAHLAPPLRAVHRPGARLVLRGRAEVERGRFGLAGLVAALFRLPRAGTDVPVEVTLAQRGAGEVWTRCFAGRRFRSHMSPAEEPGLLVERFGPFRILLAVPVRRGGLAMRVLGWRLGPVPLPRALRPRARAREWADERGRFRFDVALHLPVAGFLVRYRGWLVPDDEGPPPAG